MIKLKKDMEKRPRYVGDHAYLYMIPLDQSAYKIEGFSLFFPVRLQERIRVENGKNLQNMPLTSLHDTMSSLLSDLLFINNRIDRNISEPWLFAESPIDLGHIKNLISAWFEMTFKTRLEVGELEDLHWVKAAREFKFSIDELKRVKFDDTFVYNYLPKFLARRLKGSYLIDSLDQTLNFIPTQNDNYGQLVSWPPLEKKNNKFSYKINLSVQTIPFIPNPFLYIHVQMLRWVNQDKVFPNTRNFHVYFKEQFPWSIGDASSSFTLIEATRNDEGWHWKNRIGVILKKTGFNSLLPSCSDWMNNTAKYLEAVDTACVLAVPHGNHIRNNTYVEAGAGMPERYEIAKAVADKLGNSLTKVPKIKSTPRILKKESSYSFSEEIDLEIYYENEEWLNLTKECLLTELRHCQSVVNIIPIRSSLNINIIKADGVSRTAALKEHLPVLLNELSPIKRFTACLFELPFKDQYSDQLLDPKQLLRYAFAKSFRIVQFINEWSDDPAKNGSHRFNRGVQDLLRQLGVFGARALGLIKQDTAYVGIYNIDKRKNLKKNQGLDFPILCSIEQGQVYLTAPGMEWLPYREALITLGRKSSDIHKNVPLPEKSTNFILQAIQNLKSEKVILFAHAQNIRGTLPWFANGQINNSFFHFNEETSISNKEISVIRLRDETRSEVPEWSLIGYKKIGGVKQHEKEEVWPQATNTNLYKLNDSVYFSIAKKPSSVQAAAGATKLDNPSQYNRKETAVEVIVPVVGASQTQEKLAILTHQLRKGTSYQYGDDTLFPLPLHLAIKAKEYALIL
ncbi:pPIWI_RE module domain-containing protein [Paenibacillus terreus]|uniref:PPIWI_RE module domain-containing protein n=1 Tax=Paenibacillus terreus TaxID=1387834 RepID=A0ABV5B5N3_9BACL